MIPDDKIAQVRAAADIVDVIGSYVQLKKESKEHVACCPFPEHTEKTPSFKVNGGKQVYHCFGCGAGGDVFHFVGKHLNIKFNEAVAVVAKSVGIDVGVEPPKGKPVPPRPAPASKIPDESIKIAPFDTKPPETTADVLYDYRTKDGKLYFRVCRWNKNARRPKKDIRQLSRFAKGSVVVDKGKARTLTRHEYFWRGIPQEYRGLYNADRFAAAKTIVVVEGEKAADAVSEMWRGKDVVGTTWIGGSGNAANQDFTKLPLDKRIVLWADMDENGLKAMKIVNSTLARRKQKAAWVQFLPGKPAGWDCADAVAEGLKSDQITTGSAIPVLLAGGEGGKTAPIPPAKAAPAPTPPAEAKKPATPPPPRKSSPIMPKDIVPLGYDGDHFYFWDGKKATVVHCLQRSGSVQSILLVLGSSAHWERHFMNDRSHKINWTEAVSAIIRACEDKGVFNPDIIKGRGVHVDTNRAVLNTGDRLIIDDGTTVGIKDQGLQFDNFFSIRPNRGYNWMPAEADPAATVDVCAIANLLARLGWGATEHAIYIFGWMSIAVICGALRWRPHIWLSGASGSGKSWVLKLVRSCLGSFHIRADANTSEASIRRMADDEFLPILFDEAETKSQKQRDGILEVLALARTTASDGGAYISKAESGNRAKTYKIKSCFMLTSITMPLSDAGDVSRFMNLSLMRQSLKGEAFYEVQKEADALLARAGGAAWVLRSLRKTRQMLAAGEVFAKYLQEKTGDQRIADTRGIMLGGAWANMQSLDESVPEAEDVEGFIEAWHVTTDAGSVRNFTLDDDFVITILGGKILRVNFGGMDGYADLSVAELVEAIARNDTEVSGHAIKEYIKTLARNGMRVVDGDVLLHNSPIIKTYFRDTAWAMSWYEILKQRTGVIAHSKSMRFGAQTCSAYLSIPVTSFLKENNNAAG